ncbi:MAG: sigma-70 region 4 domain-containing protein [Bacteroidales bacterium]|nr:sigma-70 region 4 domain-containing protein [Bacteroidales bacterium]
MAETERAIVSLHLDGYSNPEIGTILGITPNLVGVKFYRAKQQLASLLKIYDGFQRKCGKTSAGEEGMLENLMKEATQPHPFQTSPFKTPQYPPDINLLVCHDHNVIHCLHLSHTGSKLPLP